MNPPSLFSNLSENCIPVQTKSANSDQAFIKKEVNRLLDEGIMVPSSSPWKAQVVVVTHGVKRRLAIDYSQTINQFTNLYAYPLPGISELIEKISQYQFF